MTLFDVDPTDKAWDDTFSSTSDDTALSAYRITYMGTFVDAPDEIRFDVDTERHAL